MLLYTDYKPLLHPSFNNAINDDADLNMDAFSFVTRNGTIFGEWEDELVHTERRQEFVMQIRNRVRTLRDGYALDLLIWVISIYFAFSFLALCSILSLE